MNRYNVTLSDVLLLKPQTSMLVSGKVINEETGQPLPGVLVQLRFELKCQRNLDADCLTDGFGNFQLTRPIETDFDYAARLLIQKDKMLD